MSYPKYFKLGQKLQLRPMSPAPAPGNVELLTAYLEQQQSSYFQVKLPYGTSPKEQYPFETDMVLEMSTDTMGLGLKMSVEVEAQPSPDRLKLRLKHDLQAFQRRHQLRTDVQVELRFTRSTGNLNSMRKLWQKNVELISSRENFSGLGKFNACEVNLSFGGIRFAIKPPAEAADLCLLLLRLPGDERPMCILAEIVWVGKIPTDAPLAGMKFLAITEDDQKRLERFVRDHGGQ